jgi:hypothetical protein
MIRGKSLALALLLLGVALMLGSAVADIVGLGATPLVFGYTQLAGTVVGALLAAVGARNVLASRQRQMMDQGPCRLIAGRLDHCATDDSA